jgi:CRISPR-associated protein Csd1
MSWIQKLYETYEQCAGREPAGADLLMPISHTMQQAQIEIVLDAHGSFKRASVLDKNQSNTMIPCTESSGGRAGSKPVNHPLCDKLQYIAGDFVAYGGEVTSGFASNPTEPHQAFLSSLGSWAASEWKHSKLDAIERYVKGGNVIKDLLDAGILVADGGKLLKRWAGEKSLAPSIFSVIQNTQSPESAFVRWRVEEAAGDPVSGTWQDAELIKAWIAFYQHSQQKRGICMATGDEVVLALQHPAKLRHAGDKAKLISANDNSGYTFRGKFTDSDQAASVGFEVAQKAHNALRWLVARQAYRKGDQAIVSWAVSGKPLLDPLASTLELFGVDSSVLMPDSSVANADQTFALRLKKAIAGYGSKLEPSEDIVFMGLDSATPGRMAITFYRELKGSDFLIRVEAWHLKCAWPQNFGKEAKFVGAPAPSDIAEAAYGRRIDDKLRKVTVERLLPCIVDGLQVPLDLVKSTTRHASNRVGLDHWEWEKCLGIACALFKGYHTERNYQMTLEHERKSRDYLYGRLLAIADSIEGYALFLTDEGKKRETTAGRLMQRFADRPFSTWRNIELALKPYESRMRAGSEKSVAILMKRRKTLTEVMSMLDTIEERTSDAPLTGEFLLAYHTQRQSFWPGATEKIENDTETKAPVIQATSTETN